MWLSTPLSWRVQRIRRKRELVTWTTRDRQGPPPHLYKRAVLAGYLSRYSLKTVVETGTYLGDMVEGLAPVVNRIYSIELDRWLFRRAQRRLSRYDNVTLVLGDSAHELRWVIDNLDGPALFWLDGHYSGGITARGAVDTPVVAELTQILNDPRDHVVLIDDAHAFDGTNGYPTTSMLMTLVERLRPNYRVVVDADIIRVGIPHE